MENKRRIKYLVVLGLGIVSVLGGTVAYFTTSTDIQNYFKAAIYQNEITEVFESPDNWTPGTTTSKTVELKNTGSIDMAVRVSYEEQWTSANGNNISLKDANGNVAAIINLNDGWTKDSDGHFYYGSKDNLTRVKPDEKTNSFIKSVTFNENIKSTLKETKSADGKTITYTSTGDGYDNATYSLTIKIDTIQYDQANSVWK